MILTNAEICRRYAEKNREKERVRGRENYAKNREKLIAQKAEYAKANRHKIRAQDKIRRAVKAGKIEKLTCEVCANEKSHAHHEDYDKPLDVVWLCRKHHARRHVEIDKENNNERPKGENAPMAKLTNNQAEEIRRVFEAEKVTKKWLAIKYGVSWQTINKVIRGNCYKPKKEADSNE